MFSPSGQKNLIRTSFLVNTVQLSSHIINIVLLEETFFTSALKLKLQSSEQSKSSADVPSDNSDGHTLIFRSMLDLKMLNEAESLKQNTLTQLSITCAFNETENSTMPPVGAIEHMSSVQLLKDVW